jgi:hypothetical protein
MDPVVILSSATVSVGPGQEARLPVRVRNQGRRVESYRVEVVGAPAAFSRVEPSTVSVLPGREAEIDVWFNPPAGASTPTGSLPFAVRATSEVDAASSAAAEGMVELAGVAGLQAWFATTARSARWQASYEMEFANQGNAAVRLVVTAHDPSGALKVTVSEDIVDLQPGGRATSKVTAKARQPFLRGNAANRIIQARCQSFPFGAERPEPGAAPPLDDPNHRTFQLTLEQKPILSKAVVALGVLVVGLLIAFVVLKLRGGNEIALGMADPEAPPTFTAEAQGSSAIFLQWAQVPNAAGYRVFVSNADGERSGQPVESLDDPITLSVTVTSLDPQTEYCYVIVAVGPEGTGPSEQTEPECATTAAPSRLRAPGNLTVEDLGEGAFNLAWDYPRNADGVEFRYLLNNTEQPDVLVQSPTSIRLIQEAAPYTATLAVRAVRGDEKSDASNSVDVTVPALPATATTSGSGTTTPTTGAGSVVPPTTLGGGPTTASPTTPSSIASTTTSATTTATTLPTSPAQAELQDLEGTWAAIYTPVFEPPVGIGVDAARQGLAASLGVNPREIRSFSNRDTIATDTAGQPWSNAAAKPDASWLYRRADDQAQATDLCSGQPGCEVLFIEGAAAASAADPDARIIVLDEIDAATSLSDVDTSLTEARTNLERSTVFVVNGADYQSLSPDQIVMYVTVATLDDVDAVCAKVDPCPTPIKLE